jgi:hypothetical protein
MISAATLAFAALLALQTPSSGFTNDVRLITLPEPAPSSPRVHAAYRVLQVSTLGALAVTGGLGVVTALNRPTLLSDGRCYTGDPIFGQDYGCSSLSTLHGIAGISTAVLYAATQTIAWTADDIPTIRRGSPGAHRILSHVHLGGMLIQPLLGIVARYPDVFGIDAGDNSDFSRTLRTIHAGLGVAIAASYIATFSMEW